MLHFNFSVTWKILWFALPIHVSLHFAELITSNAAAVSKTNVALPLLTQLHT